MAIVKSLNQMGSIRIADSLFLKRLIATLISLFCIATATFFLMKAIPGDPFSDEKALPKEIHDALIRHYALDEPLITQYLNYLKSALFLDFGPSFKYPTLSVNQMIALSFPVSLCLGAEALLIALVGGISLGILAALSQKKWQRGAILLFASIGLSIPGYLLAVLLQYVFAIQWKIFPVARWESWQHTYLPAIALAALPLAFTARLTYVRLREVLKQEFILAARAKGLSQTATLMRHALKNALLPLLGYFGQMAANILTGSFVIEKIFGIPGLGRWLVESIGSRDYPVIMGITLFYSTLLLFFVFAMDLLHAYFDPRIKASR